MALTLAQLELAFLFVLTLSLALIPRIPVPPRWAIAAGVLTGVQTAAVHNMRRADFEPERDESGLVDSVAQGVALLAVPTLTAALIAVVLFHLAGAYAFAYGRLRSSLARAARDRGGTPGGTPARRS